MNFLAKHSILLVLILLVSGQVSRGLSQEHTGDDHAHHEHHLHPRNEVGVANSVVYLGNENEFSYGLHAHYIRNIKESRFGYGLEYEQIFDDHLHRNLGILGSYRLGNSLVFSVTPGITFIGREHPEKTFALHTEITYEFEIRHFHLGPVLGAAYSGHGYHLSMGLHLAYAF